MQLPGYDIIEKAGEGGMATVWLARQNTLERVVAIKVLSIDLLQDSEAVERFKKEAQTAAKLSHPGIVQIHDAAEYQGLVYYVMEYIPGVTVSELLERKGRLTERHALTISEGVALALQYAWKEAQLIHCDIKPDNILIERDGAIKVADLGLAQVVGKLAQNAGEQDFMGTPNYVSPEQVRGATELDCRTDIYSLGAMLYHMVTGQMPFGGHPPKEVLEKQLYGYLEDPQEMNPDLTSGAAWLIEKMMLKDRTLRSQTWDDVLTDIYEILHGGVPAGKMPSAGHSTVLRGELRAKEPSATQNIKASAVAKKEAKAAADKPKQKIVLPKDVRQRLQSQPRRKKSSAGPIVARLLGLLLLVAAAYGVLVYMMNMPSPPKQEATVWDEAEIVEPEPGVKQGPAEPRATTTGTKTSRDSSFQPAKTLASRRQQREKERNAADVSVVKWDNPQFIKGAEAFNRALEKFKEYQQTRSNPGILQSVERDCRTAIAAFESCRDSAPADVNISMYINQCYRLISDTRQSMLVAPAGASGNKAREEARRAVASRAATVQANTPDAPPEEATRDLALAPTWKMPIQRMTQESEDLYALFRGQVKPAVHLSAAPHLRLFEDITYLLPIEEACKRLETRPGARRAISGGAFPRNCFFYYPVDITYGGFDKVLLMTDNSDRVAGVQLMNESSLENLWFEPHQYSDDWSTYNFIEGKKKGHAKWKIGHNVFKHNGLIQIDSELVEHDEHGYFQMGKIKARTSLLLPEQVAELLMYRLQKAVRQ